MALMHAAWLHGHALEVEFPDRLTRQWRAGFYQRLEGAAGSENWCHLAIPTPVVVFDRRLKVDSVMRYRAAGGALVHAVHVFDGETRIADHSGLSNHPEDWAFERHPVAGAPDVRWGLGISVGVRFPRPGGRLEFAAAGCDFVGTPVVVVAPPH